MRVLTGCQSGITHFAMPTVSVKMPKALHARLVADAARKRTSKSALLRDTYAKQAKGAPAGSFYERARHLIGVLDGPGNLSTLSKTLPGYGRSRRP